MTKLLTVKEAAEALRIKSSTVRSWIHKKQNLEVVKVGRAVRIPASSLRAFIRSNTRLPAEKGMERTR